jgi:hypothetical protein
MSFLLPISAGLIALALVIGAIDGLYFHLWKFRLYRRPQSRLEHWTHTLRALLLPFEVGFAYLGERTSFGLWGLLLAASADFGIAIWDVSIERESRRDLGGLPPSESVVHFVATTFHSSGSVLAMLSWPFSAWVFAPGVLAPAPPETLSLLAKLLLPGAVAVALLHVVLGLKPLPVASPLSEKA